MSNVTGFVRSGFILLFAPIILMAYPIRVIPGPGYDHQLVCQNFDDPLTEPNNSCNYDGATANLGIQSSLIGDNGFSISFQEQASLNAANQTLFPGRASYFSAYIDAIIGIGFAGPPQPLVLDITGSLTLTGFSSSAITGDYNGEVLNSSTKSYSYSDTYPAFFEGVSFWPDLHIYGSVDSGSASAAVSTTFTFQAFEADGVTPVAIIFTPEPSSFTLIAPVLAIAWFLLRNRTRRRA